MNYGVSTTSLWRQQSQLGAPGQTWPVGSTGQWHSAAQGQWQVGPANDHVSKVNLTRGATMINLN